MADCNYAHKIDARIGCQACCGHLALYIQFYSLSNKFIIVTQTLQTMGKSSISQKLCLRAKCNSCFDGGGTLKFKKHKFNNFHFVVNKCGRLLVSFFLRIAISINCTSALGSVLDLIEPIACVHGR